MAAIAGSLDANVILRLILNDVPDQHAAAIKLFADSTGQFAVSDTAIIEIVFALCKHYEFSRSAVAGAISDFMSLTEINCNRALFAIALPLFVKYPKLSFEDCCLAAYAELDNAKPLWTFDQKLANQASSARLIDVRDL